MIDKFKFRVAVSKFRASTHILEIERGRYTSPVTPRNSRLCKRCSNCVEDEYHFMMICELYNNERSELFDKICSVSPEFSSMSNSNKFKYLFLNHDARSMSWVGCYIHKCMIKRITYSDK